MRCYTIRRQLTAKRNMIKYYFKIVVCQIKS
jgi:hypothetical protein